jgi:hypothetical protein
MYKFSFMGILTFYENGQKLEVRNKRNKLSIIKLSLRNERKT